MRSTRVTHASHRQHVCYRSLGTVQPSALEPWLANTTRAGLFVVVLDHLHLLAGQAAALVEPNVGLSAVQDHFVAAELLSQSDQLLDQPASGGKEAAGSKLMKQNMSCALKEKHCTYRMHCAHLCVVIPCYVRYCNNVRHRAAGYAVKQAWVHCLAGDCARWKTKSINAH